MLNDRQPGSSQELLRGVSVLLVGYAAFAAWLQREQLAAGWPLLIGLGVAGAVGAVLASRARSTAPVRVAASFVLAAALVLPPPAALLVTLAASAAGAGGGLFGPRGTGLHGFATTGLAIALAEPLANLIPDLDPLFPPLRLVAVLLVAQFAALFLGPLFGAERTPLRGFLPQAGFELLNLPLAWLLAAACKRQAWGEALAVALLTLGASVFLVLFARSRFSLDESRRSLTLRVKELETLHVFGRELLSSLEPERIHATVERECRKVFPVDAFFIALVSPERDELVVVYRSRAGEPAQLDELPLDPGLERWIRRNKVAFRVDDLDRCPSTLSVSFLNGYRSAMGAPLIVEGRIVGLLALYSLRIADYNAHEQALLATMAQQAAVVVENAKHYQRATVDSLTGCFLREHLSRRLQEEHRRVVRYGGEFSVLMVDLDAFKPINDLHGHLAGDHYLRAVSRAIREQLRSADMACRFGGDEFCLLLPETGLEGAQVMAERIRCAVAECVVHLDDLSLCTTASIGIATFPDEGDGSVRELLRTADDALYRAKRAGRNRIAPSAA